MGSITDFLKRQIPKGKYCEDCVYLNPKERLQDLMNIKRSHICELFEIRVYHLDDHPAINKHLDCPNDPNE